MKESSDMSTSEQSVQICWHHRIHWVSNESLLLQLALLADWTFESILLACSGFFFERWRSLPRPTTVLRIWHRIWLERIIERRLFTYHCIQQYIVVNLCSYESSFVQMKHHLLVDTIVLPPADKFLKNNEKLKWVLSWSGSFIIHTHRQSDTQGNRLKIKRDQKWPSFVMRVHLR